MKESLSHWSRDRHELTNGTKCGGNYFLPGDHGVEAWWHPDSVTLASESLLVEAVQQGAAVVTEGRAGVGLVTEPVLGAVILKLPPPRSANSHHSDCQSLWKAVWGIVCWFTIRQRLDLSYIEVFLKLLSKGCSSVIFPFWISGIEQTQSQSFSRMTFTYFTFWNVASAQYWAILTLSDPLEIICSQTALSPFPANINILWKISQHLKFWIWLIVLTSVSAPLSMPGHTKVTNSWHLLWTTKLQTEKRKYI